MTPDTPIDLPADPDEPVDVWRALGLGGATLPDEQSPPVRWDLVHGLAGGTLDDETAAVAADFVRLFRPWRQAFRMATAERLVRADLAADPAPRPSGPPPGDPRSWLLGLLAGLVDGECTDGWVRGVLDDALRYDARHRRPDDTDIDLGDVLFEVAVTDPAGGTRTDEATLPDGDTGFPTTVAFGRHLLRRAVARLEQARGWDVPSLAEIARRRLAGASVAAIAAELGESEEIVRTGLRIIHRRWTEPRPPRPAGVA